MAEARSRKRLRAEKAQAKVRKQAEGIEESEEVLAGHVGAALRLFKESAELRLAEAIDAAHLLLLAQLETVVAHLAAAYGVHAWRGWTALKGALLGIATRALQEELRPLAAALTADWTRIATHGFPS